MSGHNITFDLLPLIFEKLPPKTLIQCRSVCRQWNAFIGSSYFISRHLDVTSSDPSCRSILMTSVYDGNYRLFESPRNPSHITDLIFPSTHPSWPIISILGLIHGVMGVAFINPTTKNTTLAMWNPSIHRVVVAPTFSAPIFTYGDFMVGYGFNPITNDLKIVVMPNRCMNCTTGPCTSTTASVFSSQMGWKVIENNVLSCTTWFGEPKAVFLNKSIHWARSRTTGHRTVLAFNCETEEFWTIALPERYAGLNNINEFTEHSLAGKIDLQLFRGKLAVYEYDTQPSPIGRKCKITAMIEYGVSNSWSHLFTIQLDYGMGKILMAREEDGDEIIISNHGFLFAYNTISDTIRGLGIRFEDQRTKMELFAFEPSLLLMDVERSIPYRRGDKILV